MDRAKKESVVESLGDVFESSGVVVFAHYQGLTVAEMQDYRRRVNAVGGTVRVAKNRLAKIALKGKPCESIGELLSGMTILTYSEDPVAAAAFVKVDARGDPAAIVVFPSNPEVTTSLQVNTSPSKKV